MQSVFSSNHHKWCLVPLHPINSHSILLSIQFLYPPIDMSSSHMYGPGRNRPGHTCSLALLQTQHGTEFIYNYLCTVEHWRSYCLTLLLNLSRYFYISPEKNCSCRLGLGTLPARKLCNQREIPQKLISFQQIWMRTFCCKITKFVNHEKVLDKQC